MLVRLLLLRLLDQEAASCAVCLWGRCRGSLAPTLTSTTAFWALHDELRSPCCRL
jgi:hypothetical protein